MTDIVPFQPPRSAGTSSLELAPEAWKLASRVSGTDFVPSALRGKPEAVLACILAGHEAGISPMQALAKIHVVDGRPAMAAELMRALVLRAGHDLWIEEQSSTRVIVAGQRAGSERVTRITWTMDDAKRAKLDGRNNWRNYPRAMLLARATSELCRAVFPDVLAGISHTIEEISDGDDPDAPPPPEVVEATHAPVDAPATAQSSHVATSAPAEEASVEVVAPPNRGEVPSLPGEDDVIDAEIVAEADYVDVVDEVEVLQDDDDFPPVEEYPPDDDPPLPEGGPRLTGPQIIAMKLSKLGVTSRPDKLRAVEALIGHKVETTNDLTSAEISDVIDQLDALPEGTVLLSGVTEDVPPTPEPKPTAVTPPEEWTADRWREFLKSRKVTMVRALKQAKILGTEQDPPISVGTLDDLVGSAIVSDVIGWIEEVSK